MRTLIAGGRLVDPANGVDAVRNLLLENGKVVRVCDDRPDADEIIDAAGMTVAPGFVDIHMHEDPVGPDGRIRQCIFETMLRMGVTTAVGGNCGSNVSDPLEYLRIADRDGTAVNVALYAGHETFRVAAGATDKYAGATEAQKQAMIRGVREALAGGCVGVSFGLRYVPGTDRDEFYRVAECCCAEGKLLAAHVRDDADAVFASVDELAEAGAALKLPVQVSHIGSMAGFGQMEEMLRQVEEWRRRGLDIALDCYPYDAFCTEIGATTYDDGWLERYRCGYDVLEFCEGKYRGQRATAETFREMRKVFPECLTVCHVMKPEEIRLALVHPLVMVGSDGILDDGQGHPRAAGAFPRVFAEYVRKGAMNLYTAVEKMTALPAERLGLKGKGRLNAGADADLVIFNPEMIADRADFAHPTAPPVGVKRVLIGGETALLDGRIVSSRCGRAARVFR